MKKMFGNSDLIGIPVIASFNADGRIRPLYFQYEGKTLALSVITEKKMSSMIIYNCSYSDDDFSGQIELTYWIQHHTWTINKRGF